MSLFDKLPLDITEIIYKKSLVDHFKLFNKNFIRFHYKLAKKRIHYRVIKFRKIKRLCNELVRLLNITEDISMHTSMHSFQDKIFWCITVCEVIVLNVNLLRKKSPENSEMLFVAAQDKMVEIYSSTCM